MDDKKLDERLDEIIERQGEILLECAEQKLEEGDAEGLKKVTDSLVTLMAFKSARFLLPLILGLENDGDDDEYNDELDRIF